MEDRTVRSHWTQVASSMALVTGQGGQVSNAGSTQQTGAGGGAGSAAVSVPVAGSGPLMAAGLVPSMPEIEVDVEMEVLVVACATGVVRFGCLMFCLMRCRPAAPVGVVLDAWAHPETLAPRLCVRVCVCALAQGCWAVCW